MRKTFQKNPHLPLDIALWSNLSSSNSNKYTEQTVISYTMKKTFPKNPHLPPDIALWSNLSSSNYPSLDQISMVPKLVELLT